MYNFVQIYLYVHITGITDHQQKGKKRRHHYQRRTATRLEYTKRRRGGLVLLQLILREAGRLFWGIFCDSGGTNNTMR